MSIITAKAKVFGQLKQHKFCIDKDGTVRVWDDVAGHYTLCHDMSKSAQSRIRKHHASCVDRDEQMLVR